MAFLDIKHMQSLFYSELLIVGIMLIVFYVYLSMLAQSHKAARCVNPVSPMISHSLCNS